MRALVMKNREEYFRSFPRSYGAECSVCGGRANVVDLGVRGRICKECAQKLPVCKECDHLAVTDGKCRVHYLGIDEQDSAYITEGIAVGHSAIYEVELSHEGYGKNRSTTQGSGPKKKFTLRQEQHQEHQ